MPSDEDFSRRCSMNLPRIEPWGRPCTPTPSEDLGSRPSSPEPDWKLGPSDFDLLRVVGQGAFGKVRQPAWLCLCFGACLVLSSVDTRQICL